MMERILEELNKLDAAENLFGEDFIRSIIYNEAADGYIVRVKEYPFIIIMKDENFSISYFRFIAYLTEIKNQDMNGCEPHDESSYYHDWLTFRKTYNIRKAWFYLKVKDTHDPDEITDLLIEILGQANYRAVFTYFHTPPEDYLGNAWVVMDYLGNTRAVRDLSRKYLDEEYGIQWPFHLWHLTAHTLIEAFGYFFYLGNELGSLDFCPYDYTAQEYYYTELYRKIYQNTKRDIPRNRHLTEKMRQDIWQKIRKEIFREGNPNPSSDVDEDYPADEDFCLDEQLLQDADS